MRPIIYKPGKRFDRLVVLERAGNSKGSQVRWRCKCSCGNVVVVLGSGLRKGTGSCGCRQRELIGAALRTHGQKDTPTYSSWCRMRQRCFNKDSTQYKWYGGSGVSVCKRWDSFENFLEDMGPRPVGMTLGRINPRGDYRPSNCRWESWKEQGSNRRNSRKIRFQGETLTVTQWSRRIGISQPLLHKRLFQLGWPVRRALIEPVHVF
jgi:hypothetical protein